jgi:hypothetical protein
MIAASRTKEGRLVLIIGLDDLNVTRLRDDRPIHKHLDGSGPDDTRVPGLEQWDLIIMGPEDTARFVATFGVEPPLGPRT